MVILIGSQSLASTAAACIRVHRDAHADSPHIGLGPKADSSCPGMGKEADDTESAADPAHVGVAVADRGRHAGQPRELLLAEGDRVGGRVLLDA